MRVKHLTPMLGTNNLSRTIKFYREFLNFECLGIYPDKENPVWATLWNGEVEIAFRTYEKKASMTGIIYLYVENVGEFWEKLQDLVEIVYPLKNSDNRIYEFAIKDCNGYILNIGQNIE